MGLLENFSSGLFIIQTIIFLALVVVLSRVAWKPILNAVNEREVSIQDALNQAKLAREEMKNLQAENEHIIREAKAERDSILKEARDLREKMLAEAKETAKIEGEKMIEAARHSIQAEKSAAMADIKNQIGELSVSIAENILKDKLDNNTAHNQLVENYLNQQNIQN